MKCFITHLFDKITCFFRDDFCSNTRNHYPYKLIGERISTDHLNTIVLYRILGKKGIFEIKLDELLRDPKFLEKFHPMDAVKFGVITLSDVLFKPDNKTERKNKC